jgi:hypothetical protein
MITTGAFNDLVKNAKIQWANAQPEKPEVARQLAVVKSVTDKTSEYSSVSSLPTARRRSEGGDAYKGTPKQGYNKTFNQTEIALQADVTKQMRMFDKYDEIMMRMREMKRSAVRRFEMDIAALLSYAWSTSFTNIDGETVTVSTPDGLAMISASHTVRGTSDTWSNQLTGNHAPISQPTLENLLQLFNGFLDDADGRSVPVAATHIITGDHVPTVHEVKRILMSVQESGSANNDINVNKGILQHIVVPFLDFTHATEARDSTKARYCFVANLANEDRNGFRVEVSQDMRLEAPEQVFESGTWQFQTTALYDFGTLRANFIAGTKGDGSAI